MWFWWNVLDNYGTIVCFSINMMQFEEDDMGRVGQDMIEAIV